MAGLLPWLAMLGMAVAVWRGGDRPAGMAITVAVMLVLPAAGLRDLSLTWLPGGAALPLGGLLVDWVAMRRLFQRRRLLRAGLLLGGAVVAVPTAIGTLLDLPSPAATGPDGADARLRAGFRPDRLA